MKWIASDWVAKSGVLANTVAGIIAFLLVATGCDRHSSHSKDQTGIVVFETSGITLKPGTGWTENRDTEQASSSFGSICPPRLEGQGEFIGSAIQVFLMNGRSSPQENADKLQTSADPAVIPSSFKEESLSTETGLRAIHVDYNQKAEEKDHKWLIRTHFYFVKNASGRCVGILYVTPASKDSPAVHQMIRKTLALQ